MDQQKVGYYEAERTRHQEKRQQGRVIMMWTEIYGDKLTRPYKVHDVVVCVRHSLLTKLKYYTKKKTKIYHPECYLSRCYLSRW